MKNLYYVLQAVSVDALNEELRETIGESIIGISTYALDENTLQTFAEELKTAHRKDVISPDVGDVLIAVHLDEDAGNVLKDITSSITKHNPKAVSKRIQAAAELSAQQKAIADDVASLDMDDLSHDDMKKALKLLLLERKQKSP